MEAVGMEFGAQRKLCRKHGSVSNHERRQRESCVSIFAGEQVNREGVCMEERYHE